MVKRIEKLTKEQEEKLPIWRDKWIAKGLQTGETDWETFEKYIPICYEKAKLKYPNNIVKVSSPLVGALAARVANAILKKNKYTKTVSNTANNTVSSAVDGAVKSAVSVAVSGAVGRAISGAARDAVYGAVGVAVNDAVKGAVGDTVRDALGRDVDHTVGDVVGHVVSHVAVDVDGVVSNALKGVVGGTVRDALDRDVDHAVYRAVSNPVGAVVYRAVNGAVSDAVSDAVFLLESNGIEIEKTDNHSCMGGQFSVGGWWGSPSFVSFLTEVCNLELSQNIAERAEAYQKICESVNHIWLNSHFTMVCARPVEIHRDDQGRLHNENGLAIKYPDGWGVYSINGVTVDEQIVLRPETLTIKQIQEESNQEKRRIMTERFGVDKYLKAIDATVVDIDMRGVVGAGARALMRDDKGDCWFIGTDGSTNRVYNMYVGKGYETCKAAHEALCGFSEDLIKAEG